MIVILDKKLFGVLSGDRKTFKTKNQERVTCLDWAAVQGGD
jgi:hypothetical protein